MPLLRSSTVLRSFTRRGAAASIRQPPTNRHFSSTISAHASQGYGDGKGDPKAENPQEQGSSNTKKHNAEHPGPEPPAEGQGTGGGPTKGGSGKTPADESAQSGGARSKEAKETGSSPTGGSLGKSEDKPRKNGASPKIMNHEAGDGNSGERNAEVEKHNRDFEKGHDRAEKP
jgi:hypothetical protein